MSMETSRFPEEKRLQILPVLAKFRPVAVYLFGSYGTPSERPDSDIDLAVLPASPIDPLTRFDAANQLAERFGRHIDLVDLSSASLVMAKEVLRTGTLLQIADRTRHADFEMRVLSDYARLNEERQPVLAAFAS